MLDRDAGCLYSRSYREGFALDDYIVAFLEIIFFTCEENDVDLYSETHGTSREYLQSVEAILKRARTSACKLNSLERFKERRLVQTQCEQYWESMCLPPRHKSLHPELCGIYTLKLQGFSIVCRNSVPSPPISELIVTF